MILAVIIPGPDSRVRPTQFYSALVNRNIVYGYNHFLYVLLMFLLSVSGFGSLITVQVMAIWIGLYFWISFGITIAFSVNLVVLIYGIMTNTTPNEMFNSHKHIHLWPKVEYYPNKNIVMRAYLNKNRKDWKSNLCYYLSYRAEWLWLWLLIWWYVWWSGFRGGLNLTELLPLFFSCLFLPVRPTCHLLFLRVRRGKVWLLCCR